MTSFAFILGVVPLLNATGAGAASRRAIGTAVFGGMVGATILGLIFIPALYVVVQKISEAIFPAKHKPDHTPNTEHAAAPVAPPTQTPSAT
jgi:HAE1 family hydrophobic/amphiphilic exporter-1